MKTEKEKRKGKRQKRCRVEEKKKEN